MKNFCTLILTFTFIITNVIASYANVMQEIEQANKKGLAVFLVVKENDNSQYQTARSLAEQAQKLVPKSTVIELDRSKTENSSIIQKYRLNFAALPIILVISKGGTISGGSPIKNLSAEALVKLVPTPKEEIVIETLNKKNSVFVVFSDGSSDKEKKQLKECESACQYLFNSAKTVIVNVNDINEKNFINKFKLNKDASLPITYVINTQGQVTSVFAGFTESKNLVDAANKKVSSGCCPSGSGEVCK